MKHDNGINVARHLRGEGMPRNWTLAGISSEAGVAEVWRSKNNGMAWECLLSFPGTNWIQTMIQAANKHIIVAVNVGGGNPVQFWLSPDYGNSWVQTGTATGETYAYDAVLAANGDLIVGTGPGAEFWRSQNNGQTWAQVATATGEASVRSFVVAANGDILAGTGNSAEFWRSQNNGQTWAQVSTATGESRINSLARAANGDLLAGTGGGAEFWRSQNNGQTWAQVDAAGGETEINRLFCASNGSLFAGIESSGKIYGSTDNGATWGALVSVTGDSVNSFTETRKATLLACTEEASATPITNAQIWNSKDGGVNWAYAANLPFTCDALVMVTI
jgi:photosystem II stability/assembly factor-like uncharacterized protein